MMEEKIVIVSGIFYDGSTQMEADHIKSMYPNRDVQVHMVLPGEAHIVVSDKKGTMVPNKDAIFMEAMEKAGEVLGADPAYFGIEGEEEVDRQLKKMGYSLEELREK